MMIEHRPRTALDDAINDQYAALNIHSLKLFNLGYKSHKSRGHTLISQLRIYTINRGQMDSWLKAFDGLKPLLAEHGIRVDGTWVDEDNERFIWIRSFEDQADLERKEAAFYGSDAWLANVDQIRGHLARRDITVINPS